MVFRIRAADLHRHAGPVYSYAHFLFSCAQCDRLAKSKEKNSEDFYNCFVLGALYRGYVGHAKRRNSYDKRKYLARNNEFWRNADDIPDILPLHGIHLP